MLTKAFPRITIVTSGVDPELNKSKLWIEPGMGNFGGKVKITKKKIKKKLMHRILDRYFGTEE